MSVVDLVQSMDGMKQRKAESRGRSCTVSAWVVAMLLIGWVGGLGNGAAGQTNAPGGWIGNVRHPTGDTQPSMPQLSAKQLHELNEMRQKQLVADTDRLLQLARELKRELDGAGVELSPEQMNKVSRIEKLAHNVKEKMREALPPEPMPGGPQNLWPQ